MVNGCEANKGVFEAIVCGNRQIGVEFYRLELKFEGAGAKAFGQAKAGQFAQLDLCNTAMPANESIPENLRDVSKRGVLLRRPFSFFSITAKGNETYVEILYRVLGPSSLRMRTLSDGDSISVIGPLGNGFSMPEDKKTALLVVGGMGAGPLVHLAKVLTEDFSGINVIAFAGAKSKMELPFEGRLDEISQHLGFTLREFAKYAVESLVATDDGSAGFKGPVTDCFTDWLGKNNPNTRDAIIYSCGPEPMLARMAEIAREKNIDCQVSTERRMACGMGLCQSCAVECKNGDSERTVYKMCCKDGPVFDSKEVVF